MMMMTTKNTIGDGGSNAIKDTVGAMMDGMGFKYIVYIEHRTWNRIYMEYLEYRLLRLQEHLK